MGKGWLEQTVRTDKRWNSYSQVVSAYTTLTELARPQLDRWVASAQQYKHDQTTTVVKLTLNDTNLVLKRYNARSLGHKIKRALRRSRADRCWHMSRRFAEAGLNVAAPVFMFEERFMVIRKYAYFANHYLPGEELLTLLPVMDKQQQLKVVEAMRQAMTIMQRTKISHGDMKASNLIWFDDCLYFIDLDAAQQHNSHSSWARANKRDKKRFLKNWQEMPELLDLFAWLQ